MFFDKKDERFHILTEAYQKFISYRMYHTKDL